MLAIADQDLLGLRLAVGGQGTVALTPTRCRASSLCFQNIPFHPGFWLRSPCPCRGGGVRTAEWPRWGSWRWAVISGH